jgi:hypothetical protein
MTSRLVGLLKYEVFGMADMQSFAQKKITLVITDSVDPSPHRSWSLKSANSPANSRRIAGR